MRAVKHTASGIAVVDVPEPKGDGVLVKIRSVSICGTDLSLVKYVEPLQNILGHEMAGETEDGRFVAVEPILPCGQCDQCKSANYQRCRIGLASSIGMQHDGGMAQYMRVPERCLVPLPSGVRLEDACLVEPLAVVLHGLRLAAIEPRHRVAVVGAGSIGLLAVAAVKTLGCEVSLHARHPHQIKVGEQLGATAIKGQYDVVIECAGTASALQESCELALPGGTLLFLSIYWDKITLPGMLFMGKELKVIASACYNRHAGGRDFDSAAAMLAKQPELGAIILTHRFSLEQAAEAFRTAEDRKSGAIKVVMHPD